ncbi:MAG: 6-hydroxymethylpterin diphosphokinase MptE-like protein [Spirochaetota bacterium]
MAELSKFSDLPEAIQEKWKSKFFSLDDNDISLAYSPSGLPYLETLQIKAFVTEIRVKLMQESAEQNASLISQDKIKLYKHFSTNVATSMQNYQEKENVLILADGPSKDEDLQAISAIFQKNPQLRQKTLVLCVNRLTKTLLSKYAITPDIVVVTDVLSAAAIIKRDDEIQYSQEEKEKLKDSLLLGLFYVNYHYFENWPGTTYLFFEPGTTEVYDGLLEHFQKQFSSDDIVDNTLYFGVNVSSACLSIALAALPTSSKRVFFVGHDFGASTSVISAEDAMQPDGFEQKEGSAIVVNHEGYLALVPHALYAIYDEQSEAMVQLFKKKLGDKINFINYSQGSFGFAPSGAALESIKTIERLPQESDFQ